MADKDKQARLAQLAADARALRAGIETAIANGDVSFDDDVTDALIKAHATIDAAADSAEAEENATLPDVEVTEEGFVLSAPGFNFENADGNVEPIVTLTITEEQANQIASAARGGTVNVFGIRIEN